MTSNGLEEKIGSLRAFNRFYTKQIGLLEQGYLHSGFSLTQARILYEMAQQEETIASNLIRQLDLDRGYLSRILRDFQKKGFCRAIRSKKDSRQRLLTLTAKGKGAFSLLNSESSHRAGEMLEKLTIENQELLIGSMHTIERLLDGSTKARDPFVIRNHKPGDAGWVVYRHGVLYASEYGWDETFETLVAEILVNFMKQHNPEREQLWIAEQNGERLGSVMVVDAGNNISQLRLLLVEPKTRGFGLGNLLIQQCIDFSRACGYQRMKLWTQSNLLEARHLYAKLGFKMVEKKSHHSFGYDLVSEIWELVL